MLLLGTCLIVPCFLPLLINGLKSMTEAMVPQRSAAYVYYVHPYQVLSQGPEEEGETPAVKEFLKSQREK